MVEMCFSEYVFSVDSIISLTLPYRYTYLTKPKDKRDSYLVHKIHYYPEVEHTIVVLVDSRPKVRHDVRAFAGFQDFYFFLYFVSLFFRFRRCIFLSDCYDLYRQDLIRVHMLGFVYATEGSFSNNFQQPMYFENTKETMSFNSVKFTLRKRTY